LDTDIAVEGALEALDCGESLAVVVNLTVLVYATGGGTVIVHIAKLAI